MDPLSQGLLGAIAAQSVSRRAYHTKAVLCGTLGGMAADLDILIRSSSDPLLHIAFHRHFTHSLAFVPLGGLIVAVCLWLLMRRSLPFGKAYLYTTIGYATHGLLDACTSYGTHLSWPFSDARTSWNIISIIDPVFTLSLLLFVVLGIWRKSRILPRVGIAIGLFYLSIGFWRHEAVESVMYNVAETRGHRIERFEVKPSIGNLLLWRSIYESGGEFYIDAIYATPFGPALIHPGGAVVAVDPKKDFPELPVDSIQRQDLERFAFFSNGYVARHPDDPMVVGDFRYSSLPNGLQPIWGIRMTPETPNQHIKWESLRDTRRRTWEEFWLMLRHPGEGECAQQNVGSKIFCILP